jgi:hypothetical protein
MYMKIKKSKKRKTRPRTKMNKTLRCSPKPKGQEHISPTSCYTTHSILKLRNKWNRRHPDMQITTHSPVEIHKQLSYYLKNVCNHEACWLKQSKLFGNDISSDKELTESFAPESPPEWKKNPNEWLSNIDIMKVMKQYEKAYPCFDFMGPAPINFDSKKLHNQCVWNELCHFNLQTQIEKGKTKIGIIFNTDVDTGPGEHWISMFINLKKRIIFFFDSVGDPAPKEIVAFVKRIQSQGKKLGIELMYDNNEGIQHQRSNTECGIYSIYFIVHMLEDKLTEQYIKTHIIKDSYVEKFRSVYFNPSL